jgi:hypothetical protein
MHEFVGLPIHTILQKRKHEGNFRPIHPNHRQPIEPKWFDLLNGLPNDV